MIFRNRVLQNSSWIVSVSQSRFWAILCVSESRLFGRPVSDSRFPRWSRLWVSNVLRGCLQVFTFWKAIKWISKLWCASLTSLDNNNSICSLRIILKSLGLAFKNLYWKARSRFPKTEKVSSSHKITLVSPSCKVLNLAFAIRNTISFKLHARTWN